MNPDRHSISNALGELIAHARKINKLTQQQLGSMVGVTFAAISAYERGRRIPCEAMLAKLSGALGIDIELVKQGVSSLNEARKVLSRQRVRNYYLSPLRHLMGETVEKAPSERIGEVAEVCRQAIDAIDRLLRLLEELGIEPLN